MTPMTLVRTALAFSLTSVAFQQAAFAEENKESVSVTKEMDRGPVPDGVRVHPRYPMNLARNGVSCWGSFRFIVGKDGKVEKVEPVYWSDEGWKKDCVEVISLWRFKPAIKNGRPFSCRLSIPMDADVGTTRIAGPINPKDFDSEPAGAGLMVFPNFPSKQLRKANEAKIEFVVESDGRVSGVKTASTTNEDYSKAIEKAVAKWRYTPAKKQEQAVSCPMLVTFTTKPQS